MKQRLPLYGLLLALAFALSYAEMLLPVPIGVPGVKLGLANLVVLVALYRLPPRGAGVLALGRIVLFGFTFGSMSAMLYALCGGVLSFFVMLLLKRSSAFSPLGVSVAGGVAHNIGQLLCAVCVLRTVSLSWLLPLLLLSGSLAGALVGVLGGLVLRRLPRVPLPASPKSPEKPE